MLYNQFKIEAADVQWLACAVAVLHTHTHTHYLNRLSFWVTEGAGAYPSGHWTEGRETPGPWTAQKSIARRTYTFAPRDNLSSPLGPPKGMSYQETPNIANVL